MRIVCVTNLFPDTSRPGFAAFNRQQIVHMARLHSLRVLTPVPWPHMLRLLAGGRRPRPTDECAGIDVDYPAYYYTPWILRDLYWRFYYHSVRGAFRRAVREFRPELVYSTWAYPDCRAALRLAGDHGLPMVCRIHGSDINDYMRYPGRKKLILEAMNGAGAVISVNRNLASILRREGVDQDKIHVVYNGIDRSIFRPTGRDAAREALGLDRNMRMILFAGNLKPVKGVDLLIRAFGAIEGEDLELHIVGDGPESGRLRALASKAGDDVPIFFHGRARHGDMAAWYNASDLFCLPSLNEGTPNVILEALACAVPVVAADTGGIPEILSGESGVMFSRGDWRSLAAALEKGLSTDWDRGRIDCPAGTWGKNAQILSDIFEKVVRSGGRAEDGTDRARSP